MSEIYQVWRWKPVRQRWIVFGDPCASMVEAHIVELEAKDRYCGCCTMIESIPAKKEGHIDRQTLVERPA